jgi:hypothetical protein
MGSAADIRDFLLPDLGKKIGATMNDTETARMVQDINSALHTLLGQQLAEDRSELVRAPQSVTLDVTNGSTAITFSGYASWMLGCTIKIGSTWNRLQKLSSDPSLEQPWLGETTAGAVATVYQDCVNLSYALESVLEPVRLGGARIFPLPNKQVLEEARAMRNGDNNTTNNGEIVQASAQYYLIEDSLSYLEVPATRFQFDTLPTTQQSLQFSAALRAPQITSLSDTRTFLLPGGRDMEILRPVVRNLFRTFPQFIGDVNEVKLDAQQALQKWSAYSNKGPQPGTLEIYGV